MTPKPPKTPRCFRCNASLSGARLVVDGWWWCPDCVYELEHGPAERVPKKRRTGPPQEEGLFPLPPPRRARRDG